MALLNRPNVLPNAMHVIADVIRQEKRVPVSRLRGLAQPESLPLRQSNPSTFDASLKGLCDLGLVVLDGDEVHLDRDAGFEDTQGFQDLLRAAVFENSDGTADDVLGLLSWWCAQDPYGEPFNWTAVRIQWERQYRNPADHPFDNSTPWDSFERWLVPLGFAERDRGGIVPDIGRAVRRSLYRLDLPHNTPLQLTDVVSALQRHLTVVDGGALARRTRELLKEGSDVRASPQALDVCLSAALLRAREDSVVELTDPSDAQRRVLLSDGGGVVALSQIVLLPEMDL